MQQFSPPMHKKRPSKLIAGLAAFLATGIITASGFAGATPGGNNGNGNGNNNHPHPASNSQTANTRQNATINHGYGGGNTSIINNISLNVNGNNNIIQVVINIFR